MYIYKYIHIVYYGGTACLTPLVQHMCSSKVANDAAK